MKYAWKFGWLICVALMLVACSAPKLEPVPAGATVLVLGDSLSYGTGAQAGEDYPSLLAEATGWDIVNAGVPGDTSAEGLARLPALLQTYAPQLVLVELGGNDFLRKLPSTETAANLTRILQQLRERSIPVVLVGVPQPNLFGAALGQLEDAPLYGELADKTETLLIEGAFSEALSQPELKADPVHPNAAGYRRVAEHMHEALQDLGLIGH